MLDHLIRSEEPSIKPLTIDVLVRDNDATEILHKAYGDRVRPIPWTGFTDIPFVTNTAANYDIIINAGTGFLPDGARALVHGLARRTSPVLPAPWMLHTSGCSNLADRPLTQTAHPDRAWDDADSGAVYEFLKNEDARDPYPQRTIEIAVLAAAEEAGRAGSERETRRAYSAPARGSSTGRASSSRCSRATSSGTGTGSSSTRRPASTGCTWGNLAEVYVLLVRAILEREDHDVGYIPSGRHGIISTAVGRVLQTEMMRLCLDAAFDAGVLPRGDTPEGKEICLLELKELAEEIMGGLVDMAERSWAGHKVMKGTVARELLGWNPTRLDEAWKPRLSGCA